MTSIARIWLVRHGPSSHVHDGRWMHHTIVPGFEDAYDSMGIIPDCVPPAHLLRVAATVDAICSSDLPRATESAQRLALGREVLISPLLREIRLEPPRWIPLALPIEAWDVMNYLQWSYRLRIGADHEFVRRAGDAADWLEGHVRRSKTLLAVTHGGFRRLVAARLVARGWRSRQRKLSYANWSSWELERN